MLCNREKDKRTEQQTAGSRRQLVEKCFTYACIVQPHPINFTSQPPYPQRLHLAYSSLFIVDVFPNKTPGFDVIDPPMSMSSVSKVDIIM